MRLTPVQLTAHGSDGPASRETRGCPSIARGGAADAILDRLRDLSHLFGTLIAPAAGVAVIRAE
jgi:hypothetical protein